MGQLRTHALQQHQSGTRIGSNLTLDTGFHAPSVGVSLVPNSCRSRLWITFRRTTVRFCMLTRYGLALPVAATAKWDVPTSPCDQAGSDQAVGRHGLLRRGAAFWRHQHSQRASSRDRSRGAATWLRNYGGVMKQYVTLVLAGSVGIGA